MKKRSAHDWKIIEGTRWRWVIMEAILFFLSLGITRIYRNDFPMWLKDSITVIYTSGAAVLLSWGFSSLSYKLDKALQRNIHRFCKTEGRFFVVVNVLMFFGVILGNDYEITFLGQGITMGMYIGMLLTDGRWKRNNKI